jgi:hypothetical protein
MLFLLRKIRRKLMKDNKVGTYLLYAIGEIFLVVVGILIAVQIDDWNESRKNQEIASSYKSSLVNDLKRDTTMLKALILDIEQDLIEIESIEKRLSHPLATLDTLFDLVRNESKNYIVIQAFFDFNDNTIEELISSGKMSILGGALSNELFEFRQAQNQIAITNQFLINPYISTVTSFISNYPTDYPTAVVKKGPLYERFWKDVDANRLMTQFNGLNGQKRDYYRLILPALKNIKIQTQELLKSLE